MWKMVKLGDVCKITNGSTPLRKEKRYWAEGNIPWFTIDDLRVQGKNITHTNQNVTQAAVDDKKVKLVPVNSVLLCCTASIGAAAIARVEMATNQQFNALTPKSAALNSDYLYFVATTLTQTLLSVSGSTTINFVSMSKLKEISIPLPPLAEQERIVAKLDAAFAGIDEAVQDSKKQETEVLKFGYRAITNKLKNLANIYSSKPLNDVVIIQPKKKLALEKISESDDVSFMGMKELGIEQKYTEAINTKPLNEVFKSYQYFEENDVVFAKITPCYENGKLGIMKNLKNGIGFGSSEFVVLRPNSEVHSEYIYYCLLDETFRKNGTKNMSGAVGHKRVTKDYYFNYQITVPPLSIQIECIKEFDEIWKQAEIISKLKHKKINELISLKSAILKQELQFNEAA